MVSSQQLLAKISANVEVISRAVTDLQVRLKALEDEAKAIEPALQDIDTKLTALQGSLTVA